MIYDIKKVHISTIKRGDTVHHNGHKRTVGKEDIKSTFMGYSLWGDSYKLGSVLVKKIIIKQTNLWGILKQDLQEGKEIMMS